MKIPITSIEQKTRAAHDGMSSTNISKSRAFFRLPDDPEQRAQAEETIGEMKAALDILPPLVPISTKPLRYHVPKVTEDQWPLVDSLNDTLAVLLSK